MAKHSQRYNHEEHLQQQLKKRLFYLIFIPVAIIVAFTTFGPTIGRIFGFISVNRNAPAQTDTIAPTTPIFVDVPKATKETEITLNGFSEPGATVVLFVNGPEVETTLVSSEGTFMFESIKLIKGRNTISAKAIDTDQNESERSVSKPVIYDDEAPEIEIESPQNETTIKNLNKRVTIKGNVNEKVSLKINERAAILKPDLTFEYLLGVEEGWNGIKIEATDEAGNKTEEEFKINYVKSGN